MRSVNNYTTLLFSIIALLALPLLSNSLEVECDYGYPYDWRVIGRVLTCTIKEIKVVEKNENITKITGDLPFDESTNETISLTMNDVKLVNIVESQCQFFPGGFEKFFPNLEGVRVGGSRLTALTHENLMVFPKLRYVDMWHNNIDMLDTHLFTSTPNIEYLYFGDNSIKYIGVNTFTPIKNLSYAIFQSNSCIEKNAHTLDEVQDLIRLARLNCVPNDEVADKAFCGDKFNQLVISNENLKVQFENLMNEHMNYDLKIHRMRNQMFILNDHKNQLISKNEVLTRQANANGATSDIEIENKIQKLEEENQKLKADVEKLNEENSKLKKNQNDKKISNNWKLILLMFAVVTVVGSAGGYLFYNRKFIFKSGDGERLT